MLSDTPTKVLVIPIDENLELRERLLEDAEELFALTDANRAYLRRWLPWLQFCRSADDTRWNIHESLQGAAEGLGLAVTIRESGRIVGVTGFNSIGRDNRTGQIGYWLGQEHQGRGIMTRAVAAILRYGFTKLDMNRIVIAAATGNSKSRALAERLGFQFEGIAREAEWLYGRVVDHANYALLRADWERMEAA